MKSNQKKGNILLHVILLVNIVLIVGVVVFNNSFVVVNNIDLGNNQEEVFTNIYDKGHIVIDSVVKYNANGGGFLDGISCPSNVTMSGTTLRTAGMSTTLVYEYGAVHCTGTYQGQEFKIFYDAEINGFQSVKYEDEVVLIAESAGTSITVGTTNMALGQPVYSSAHYSTYYNTNAVDGNDSTYFDSNRARWNEYIGVDLGSEKEIGKIILKKPPSYAWGDWDSLTLKLRDGSDTLISDFTNISFPIGGTHEIDLLNYGLSNSIRYVSLHVSYYYLFIAEIEIYELLSSGSEEVWEGQTNFTNDDTYFSFTSDGISGNNGIDDDLNSDNYKVTSIGNIYFPNGYQDDDVVPRKTVFGSLPGSSKYEHIYWNNYKTIDVIDKNTNNDDVLNVKMGDIDAAYMILDTFNDTTQDYDLKILEFDREIYKNNFTLLPLNTNEGKNITDFIGYIQKDPVTGALTLSKGITGNEFIFDFQNNDYAFFLKNNTSGTLTYHMEAETTTGTGIYITPVDDSGSGTISVLSNHIIIGGEKNFIGENFTVVGSK